MAGRQESATNDNGHAAPDTHVLPMETGKSAASSLAVMLVKDNVRQGGHLEFPGLGVILGPENLPDGDRHTSR